MIARRPLRLPVLVLPVLALVPACSSSAGGDDDGPRAPVAGHAFLTIVGERDVFVDGALGQTLTVTPGTWEVDGTEAPVQQIYRWRRAGRVVATGETYTVSQADLGKRLRVQALAYTPGHELGSAYSTRVQVLGDPAATNTADSPFPPRAVGAAACAGGDSRCARNTIGVAAGTSVSPDPSLPPNPNHPRRTLG